MESTYQKTVGEIVANDYRTAAVFGKYGIDFCCKGNISVDEACEKKNLPTENIMREIKKIQTATDENLVDYKNWPLDQLIAHIETKHHTYVTERTPILLAYLEKLCQVHGVRHPELFDIHRLFKASAGDLAQHMKKEELILFPRIRKLIDGGQVAENLITPGMIHQPVAIMMDEHDAEGTRFSTIAELTNHYQVPADGCSTYRATFGLLKEFEEDLHKHIHLENNILFPRAIEMEKELMN